MASAAFREFALRSMTVFDPLLPLSFAQATTATPPIPDVRIGTACAADLPAAGIAYRAP